MPSDAALARPRQVKPAAPVKTTTDKPAAKGLGRRYHLLGDDGVVVCDSSRSLDPEVDWGQVDDDDRCHRCVRIEVNQSAS